jgi:hypothetical protein
MGTPTPVNSKTMTLAFMISPTGQFDNLYVNGEDRGRNFTHIHLLMGRSENGGIDPDNTDDLDFRPAAVAAGVDGDDIVAERRAAYNWLNADSRWVNIDAASGRVVASDVASPIRVAVTARPGHTQIPEQIEASRAFAEQMETQGGR